jgi:hypothetical protein
MYVTNELEVVTMNIQQFTKAVLNRQLKGIIFQDQEEKKKFIETIPERYKWKIANITTVLEGSNSLKYGMIAGEYVPITEDNEIVFFSWYSAYNCWDFIGKTR